MTPPANALHYECPHCGQAINYAPEHSGMSGACPKCSNAITLPASVTAFTPSDAPSGATSELKAIKTILLLLVMTVIGYMVNGTGGAIFAFVVMLIIELLFKDWKK